MEKLRLITYLASLNWHKQILFLQFRSLPESISSFGVSVSILVKDGDLIKDARFSARFNLFLSNSPDVSILCIS